MAAPLAPDGVIAESSPVALSSGLVFSIPDGFGGRVQGHHYRSSGITTKTGASNSNSLARRDRLVLRLDRAAKTLVLAIKQGTPSSGTPPLPTLTQTTTGVYEIPVCYATCPGNGSAQNYHTLVQEYVPVSSARWAHAWAPSGTIPVDSTGVTVPWLTTAPGGIATLSGSTQVYLTRPGIWSLTLKAYSEQGPSGLSKIWLQWPAGSTGGFDTDSRWRGEGFAGANRLDQRVTWMGLVSPAAAASPITAHATWQANSGAVEYSFQLNADYLGG